MTEGIANPSGKLPLTISPSVVINYKIDNRALRTYLVCALLAQTYVCVPISDVAYWVGNNNNVVIGCLEKLSSEGYVAKGKDCFVIDGMEVRLHDGR